MSSTEIRISKDRQSILHLCAVVYKMISDDKVIDHLFVTNDYGFDDKIYQSLHISTTPTDEVQSYATRAITEFQVNLMESSFFKSMQTCVVGIDTLISHKSHISKVSYRQYIKCKVVVQNLIEHPPSDIFDVLTDDYTVLDCKFQITTKESLQFCAIISKLFESNLMFKQSCLYKLIKLHRVIGDQTTRTIAITKQSYKLYNKLLDDRDIDVDVCFQNIFKIHDQFQSLACKTLRVSISNHTILSFETILNDNYFEFKLEHRELQVDLTTLTYLYHNNSYQFELVCRLFNLDDIDNYITKIYQKTLNKLTE